MKEQDEDAPFFNRAISGSYPPASTIKPFLGLLGLEEKVIEESTVINDEGFFRLMVKEENIEAGKKRVMVR